MNVCTEGAEGIEMQPLNGQDQKAGGTASGDEPADAIDVVVVDGKQKNAAG